MQYACIAHSFVEPHIDRAISAVLYSLLLGYYFIATYTVGYDDWMRSTLYR